MNNVIKSVTKNSKSILLTAILALILVYMFSIIGYLIFWDQFIGDDDDNQCSTLAICIVTTLNNGLRSGGGIGDFLKPQSPDSDSFYPRVIYDLAFFFILIIIVLNLIFGVIIDTFGELREKKQNAEDVLLNSCFICGLKRIEFDCLKTAQLQKGTNVQEGTSLRRGILFAIRAQAGYDQHIKHEHNMWHYISFIVYMKLKDNTEYTGPESYVSEQILKNSVEWFPKGRSISLQTAEENMDSDGNDNGTGNGNSNGISNFSIDELKQKLEANAKAVEKLAVMLKSVQVLVNEQQKKEQQSKRKAQLRARIGRDSSHEGMGPGEVMGIPAYRHTVMAGNMGGGMGGGLGGGMGGGIGGNIPSNMHQAGQAQNSGYGGIHPLYEKLEK